MQKSPIISIDKLGFPWETADPFLFCVHHADAYPRGNDALGPDASLAGRNLGMDFQIRDGWRMYHGETVPGFPAHPHRGFETVTVVLKGYVDHSDSNGGAGRYGNGDVQWMTAGSGLQHAEMFPLLSKEKENPLELFQIWLNLPKAAKFVEPHYTMLWAEKTPRLMYRDERKKKTQVLLLAGVIGDSRAQAPAPDSWAADAAHDVAIWLIDMEPEARWTLPPAAVGSKRRLYFFEGEELLIGGHALAHYHVAEVDASMDLLLENGSEAGRLLILQGLPISEPVVQYGPFVMNSRTEIQEAYEDFQRNRFGGWPWERPDPVHSREVGRFARYADGKEERPG